MRPRSSGLLRRRVPSATCAPPALTSRDAAFGTVSVVMIASAAALPPQFDVSQFNPTLMWTEYLNRLLGVTVGLLILATTIAAWRRHRHQPRIVWTTTAALVLTGFQGWLGGLVVAGLLFFFFVLPAKVEVALNGVGNPAPYSATPEAAALHKTLVVADLHADSLLWGRDLVERGTRGHVDIPRLIEGNVALQVFSVVTQSPRGLNIDLIGLSSTLTDTLDSLQGGLIVAVAVIFLMLAANFQSFKVSAIVLSTVPAVLLGALGLLMLAGSTLNLLFRHAVEVLRSAVPSARVGIALSLWPAEPASDDRADVAVSQHPLRAAKQELELHGHCAEIPLDFLGVDAVAEYLSRRFARPHWPPELARALHRRTDGNPLFLVTTVDDLVAQGHLRAVDGRWSLSVPVKDLAVGAPRTLSQMVERQAERLAPDEQAVDTVHAGPPSASRARTKPVTEYVLCVCP